MTPGEISVLLGGVFLAASALLCVIYGLLAGSGSEEISCSEKEQESFWQDEEAKIDDELTGGV